MECPETLRNWIRQAERDSGQRPGLTTAEQQRFKVLEHERLLHSPIESSHTSLDELGTVAGHIPLSRPRQYLM